MEVLGKTTDGPGTHALVIGVSSYPHTNDFDDLTCAARSAAEVAHWLLHEYRNPDAPLASLHLSLSPSPGEVIDSAVAALVPQGCPATRAEVERDVRDFWNLCANHPDDVAFVYVAGHGVQFTKSGALLLLEDYDPNQFSPLEGAIDMAQLHTNMNGNGFPSKQVWFVDACRKRSPLASSYELLVAPFPPRVVPNGQVDSSPVFLAASSDEAAFAVKGDQTLFSIALLDGLRHAVDGPDDTCEEYNVSVTSLEKRLVLAVTRLALENGVEQRVDLAGRPAPAVIHRFAEPPKVHLVVDIHPNAAAATSTGTLYDEGVQPHIGPTSTWPLVKDVPMGLYTLVVSAQAPFNSIPFKPLNVSPPPRYDYRVAL